jgi:WD40 repeat protein
MALDDRKNDVLSITIEEKISCLSVLKFNKEDEHYLVALGHNNGTIRVIKILLEKWESEEFMLPVSLHGENVPIKDIAFYDDWNIVTAGLDKSIKMLSFSNKGKPQPPMKEFKKELKCRGMKIDKLERKDVERKKLNELIKKSNRKTHRTGD